MLIYVDSPFQLLQCYELVKTANEPATLFIRLNGKVENDKQLLAIKVLLGFDDAQVLKIVTLFERFYAYLYILLRAFFHKDIVVGDANSVIFKILKACIPTSRFILLDDGVATINNPKENALYRRFTIFPNHVKDSINNTFENLATLLKTENAKKVNVIIGAKFIEENICSSSTYFQAVKGIVNYFNSSSQEILYIPHRGESDDTINYIANNFTVTVVRTKYPIELIAYELNVEPQYIAHVLSTAVYSMRLIYPESHFYTYQVTSKLLLDRHEAITNLYAQLKSDDFSEFLN